MEHIVIISGGYLNMEFAEKYLKTLSYDRVFAVDKGLEYVHRLGLRPDYIVGDFDTVDRKLLAEYEKKIVSGEIQSYVERYPEKKDATDTELALIKAVEEGAGQITVLASTGCRLDHVLANLGMLLQTVQAGAECCIVDETNRIRLLCAEKKRTYTIEREKQYGTYLSVIPLTEQVEGLTLEGVMYPLDNRTVYQGNSLTVSNQITEEEARISFTKGRLLVIESKDK